MGTAPSCPAAPTATRGSPSASCSLRSCACARVLCAGIHCARVLCAASAAPAPAAPASMSSSMPRLAGSAGAGVGAVTGATRKGFEKRAAAAGPPMAAQRKPHWCPLLVCALNRVTRRFADVCVRLTVEAATKIRRALLAWRPRRSSAGVRSLPVERSGARGCVQLACDASVGPKDVPNCGIRRYATSG